MEWGRGVSLLFCGVVFWVVSPRLAFADLGVVLKPLVGLEIRSYLPAKKVEGLEKFTALQPNHVLLIYGISEWSGAPTVYYFLDQKRFYSEGTFDQKTQTLRFEAEIFYSESESSDCPLIQRETLKYEIQLKPKIEIQSVKAERIHFDLFCASQKDNLVSISLPSYAPALFEIVKIREQWPLLAALK